MIFIGLEEVRAYYQQYTCELLTSKEENKKAILSFKTNSYSEPLVNYLQNSAWQKDEEGATKVYLIKDTAGKIASYFSLRCGLMYERDEKLSKNERNIFESLYEEMKKDPGGTRSKELENTYFAATAEIGERQATRLYEMARDKLDAEEYEARDPSTTERTKETYPAIELGHYCKNTEYVPPQYNHIPLGFALFWEVIVPQICKITNLIGCKFVYLFAADKTSDIRKGEDSLGLVDYYKSAYKFENNIDLAILKPVYDSECYALVQEISALKENRVGIWQEYPEFYV